MSNTHFSANLHYLICMEDLSSHLCAIHNVHWRYQINEFIYKVLFWSELLQVMSYICYYAWQRNGTLAFGNTIPCYKTIITLIARFIWIDIWLIWTNFNRILRNEFFRSELIPQMNKDIENEVKCHSVKPNIFKLPNRAICYQSCILKEWIIQNVMLQTVTHAIAATISITEHRITAGIHDRFGRQRLWFCIHCVCIRVS